MRRLGLLLLFVACSSTPAVQDGGPSAGDAAPSGSWCHPDQHAPYAQRSTFPGLHAGGQNWNRVPCTGPSAVEASWTALQGLVVFQPATISGDGATLFATVARTGAADCKIYAVNTLDGSQRCLGSSAFSAGVSGSSVELDADGFAYVTDGYTANVEGVVVKFDPSTGKEIWRAVLPNLGSSEGAPPSTYRTPAGLHFTPDGHAVTATVDGVVVLIDRSSGKITASLPLQTATGIHPQPAATAEVKLPPYFKRNIEAAVGTMSQEDITYMFSASLGNSGKFGDNTIGVSPRGQLFITGPGRRAGEGSLIAIDITESAQLRVRWISFFIGGSATSPVVSSDGARVVIGDNASNVNYIYVDDCNNNHDADSDPNVCSPKWTFKLPGQPLLGAPAMDEDGIVYAWASNTDPSTSDLFAIGDEGGKPRVIWEKNLTPAGDTYHVWSSAATVLDNMIIGTVTNMKRTVSAGSAPIPLVLEATHEVMAIDRKTGVTLWSLPVADDSINSLLMGPDGSIFVPELGMLDLSSPNEKQTFTGGIARIAPLAKTRKSRAR